MNAYFVYVDAQSYDTLSNPDVQKTISSLKLMGANLFVGADKSLKLQKVGDELGLVATEIVPIDGNKFFSPIENTLFAFSKIAQHFELSNFHLLRDFAHTFTCSRLENVDLTLELMAKIRSLDRYDVHFSNSDHHGVDKELASIVIMSNKFRKLFAFLQMFNSPVFYLPEGRPFPDEPLHMGFIAYHLLNNNVTFNYV